MIVRRIGAPPEAVIAAAAQPISTGFADAIDPRVHGETITWTSPADVADRIERFATVAVDGDGARLELRARSVVRMPYFRWLFAPLVRAAARRTRSCRH